MILEAIKRFFGGPSVGSTKFREIVLKALEGGQKSGRTLQRCLRREGVLTRLAPFYFAMSRMEKDGLVEGRYRPVVISGQQLRERYYTILPGGLEWIKGRAGE